MSNSKYNQLGRASRRQDQRSQPGRRRSISLLLAGVVVLGIGLLLAWVFRSPNKPPSGEELSAEIPATNMGKVASSLGLATNNDPLVLKRNKEKAASEWNQRANNLLKMNDTNGAIQAYKEAILLTPEDEDLHFNLGIAFAKSRDYTNAEREYIEALKLLPDYPEVHNNLGNVLMRQDRVPEALAHFREAIKQMPEYAQAHNNLGILFQGQKLTNDALACFQKAVEIDTNYWEAHFNLASSYFRINEREKGIAELRETLRINPSFQVAQQLLAKNLGQAQTNSPTNSP